MTRSGLSRPLMTALADGLLRPAHSVFDYGCGRGDDLRNLRTLGYNVEGWDPTHRPGGSRVIADIVNLGYVINVIEDPQERAETLLAAWRLTREVLVVSARLTWDARDLVGTPINDGLLTNTGTFQKFYEQAELSTWIEETLHVKPLAAAPGIFYIFRQPTAAQQFLSTRVRVYRPRARIDPHAAYAAHEDILAPLFEFLTSHARAPRPGELAPDDELAIREACGSVGRGLRLIVHATDDAHWQQVTIQRGAELLIYIALSRFGRRPKLGELTPTLIGDIRMLFGSYRSACVRADRLLLACGDSSSIFMSARSSPVGKQTPTALYVHRSALAELPPILQVYEGCARVLSGTVDQANLIKLSVSHAQVSYLSYPRFDRDAHPTLSSAVTVNLRKLSVDWRDYRRSENPPLLHRKEEFIGQGDPRRELYSKLTRSELRTGLYEYPERIGTLRGWEETLSMARVVIRGHRLQKVLDADQPGSPASASPS